MQKEKMVSIILKIVTIIIILIGISVFVEYKLWEEANTDFKFYLKVFVSILVLGFSGTLYGMAMLLDKNKK